MIRALKPGDEGRLDQFLRRHADSSLFLRSNALNGGLRDEGRRLQATYVAEVADEEVIAVVAHGWNGNPLLQAPVNTGELCRRAAAITGRPVAGLIGPWDQVLLALQELGLAAAEMSLRSREDLFAVDLNLMRVPERLTQGSLICRPASAGHGDVLAEWRRAYRVEALGEVDRPELLVTSREDIIRGQSSGDLFVLEDAGQPVATCAFNARHPACVQIGGVWAPPEMRRRGYGRAVVAGALVVARTEGVARSVLFTDEENVAARTAYLSLGYQRVGDYGLVLFREGQQPR